MAIAAQIGKADSNLQRSRDWRSIRAQGQRVNERGGCLARRRYQSGSVFLREVYNELNKLDRERSVWVGRWREDEIEEGKTRRVRRSQVLGTLADLPTEKLAKRELEPHLAKVNHPGYRAQPSIAFLSFSERWQSTVLVQYQPSTQPTIRGHLRKYLEPYFGGLAMRDVQTETVQQFISALNVSPKTARNIYITLRMMWNSARAWGYALHNPLDGVRLPKPRKARQFFFSLEEVQRILAASSEPYRTFFWLAAETGMWAGELCGLCVRDLELQRGLVHIRQSAWRGKLQDPKTENADRTFALSSQLVEHLGTFLASWRPNTSDLLFSTRAGTPWDANLVVKRKLHPLLASLKIERGGLHAFRHANATLMDRFNVPVEVRQQRLGHSDPKITLGVYTHVASEDDQRIAAQLGQVLDPNGPTKKNAGISQAANSGFIN